MKKRIILILISLQLFSCSHNIIKTNFEKNEQFFEKVNKIATEKEARIITKNDEEYFAAEVSVDKDSVYFLDSIQNKRVSLLTKDIDRIEFQGTGIKGIEGFLFGGLAGGIVGNILSNPSEDGLGKAIYVVGGVLFGGITGVLYAIKTNPKTIVKYNWGKKMTKLFFYSFLLLVNFNALQAHGQGVHQYLVRESYKLLNKITFDASKLSSGIYFYTMKTNENYEIKKMMLIR